MISSNFPKSFRDARDLVVFYEYFCDFHQASPSHKHPLNSSEICLKSPDGVLIKFREKSKAPFLYSPSPVYNEPEVRWELSKTFFSLCVFLNESLKITHFSNFQKNHVKIGVTMLYY